MYSLMKIGLELLKPFREYDSGIIMSGSVLVCPESSNDIDFFVPYDVDLNRMIYSVNKKLDQKLYYLRNECNDDTYEKSLEVWYFSYKGKEINVIVINDDNTVDFVKNTFDLSICQVYYDNELVETDNYKNSVKNKTITYFYDSSNNVEKSLLRLSKYLRVFSDYVPAISLERER